MDVWFLLKLFFYGLILIIFLLVYFLEDIPTPRRYWLIQKLPGPRGVFYFGNSYDIKDIAVEDFLIWVENHVVEYERLLRIWFLGVSHVYLKEPQDIQVVLNSKDHITKGKEYDYVKDWLNEGLLTSTGEKWFGRRKLLTPAFHFKILDDNMPVFNKNAKKLCEKFGEFYGQEVSIEKLLTLCTLDVIVSTSMGIDIDAQSNRSQKYVNHIKRVSEIIVYRSMRPIIYKDWIFALSPSGKLFWKTVKTLHDFSYKVIEERKERYKKPSADSTDNETIPEGGKVRRALLDTLLEIERNSPGTLSDKDIREEVDTFMFEGHDTTSTALVFIFFNLAAYPDIQDKVYKELEIIFHDTDRDITNNDLNQMVYLEKVIKESLRLYPSVPYITRRLKNDLILDDGIIIPAPSNLVVPIYILHRNEKFWPDPDKFDPERFSEEQSQGRHPYAYLPFSAGPRNCIGQKFAMMELKIVVATVVRKLKIIPVSKREDFKRMIHLVLRPSSPILCKFEPR